VVDRVLWYWRDDIPPLVKTAPDMVGAVNFDNSFFHDAGRAGESFFL
jgi:hypothetical protein